MFAEPDDVLPVVRHAVAEVHQVVEVHGVVLRLTDLELDGLGLPDPQLEFHELRRDLK